LGAREDHWLYPVVNFDERKRRPVHRTGPILRGKGKIGKERRALTDAKLYLAKEGNVASGVIRRASDQISSRAEGAKEEK